LPLASPPLDRVVSVADPAMFFLGTLRVALAQEGIEVRGRTRVAPRPHHAMSSAVIVHDSAPLWEVAQRLMKNSQNLYGEVLLRVLMTSESRDSSPTQGRNGLQETLATLGVPAGAVQGLDGSGLSRRNFTTARAIVTLLQKMGEPPHRDPFRATLPIAGTDGTLANRFTNHPCEGRLLAKTGTLSHARALAGYVTSASGTPYVFTVIANNFLAPSREIDGVVDEALALLCRSGDARPGARP
jgi:serine-type D-Ala-D-Ala carboxypeptidase/endopeptidase (penicillin-binding protein 4)